MAINLPLTRKNNGSAGGSAGKYQDMLVEIKSSLAASPP